MLASWQIRWFYILGILFIGLSMLAIALDFYYILALPLIPILLYFVFAKGEYIFYFLAFATPLSIPVQDIGGGFGLSLPTEPLMFALFGGLVFQLFKGKVFSSKVLKEPLTIIILIDILWMVITSISSTMPWVSLKYTLARSWFVLIFFFAAIHLFRKPRAIEIFLWCLTLGTSILVLYTLKNHAAESFSRLYSYTAMRPFLPDHGMYAAAISFFIPPMLIIGLFGKRMGYNWFTVAVALGMFAIITIGVIFSFTRASWLSLVASFGVMFLLFLRIQFKHVLGFVLILGAGFLLFQNTIWQELSRNKQDSDDDLAEHVQSFSNVSTDPSNLERLNRWSCAYRMFLDKPILGFGPGTYTYEYAPYQISSEMSIISTHSGDLGNVHSEYLRPFAESGALSGLLWLIMVLLSVNMGFKTFYQAADVKSKFLTLGILLGLVTYFTHAFLNNYSDFDKIAVPMWGFMAIIFAIRLYHLKSKGEATINEKGQP